MLSYSLGEGREGGREGREEKGRKGWPYYTTGKGKGKKRRGSKEDTRDEGRKERERNGRVK